MGLDYERIRSQLLEEPIRDYSVSSSTTVCELVEAFEGSHGFMAGHVARAARILAEMWSDREALRVLSFTGNLVSTGLRGVLAQLVREGFASMIMTTAGAVDHDVARSFAKYYRGDWAYDDAMLRDLDIHRLGNVLVPKESYGLAIERFARGLLDGLAKVKKEWRPSELLREAGRRLEDPNSFLRAASDRGIPVFVPGFVDGAFGTQVAFHSTLSGLKLDVLGDEIEISNMIFSAAKLGALIVGGGIAKHHTIWWAQFKDGLDYAIYVTTAVEYDGSLSGAQPREAISWNKLKPAAKSVAVHGDATVVLPLIVAGALCLMGRGRA
ncbi:MAG: deoxyhypusine synthase [Desulfurococcaceae archaeon]